MYGQTHAGLGWVIGVLPPGDRRLRVWCVTAALLPDVDAGAMLFGMDAYVRWHHKPGHNIFLGILCVLAAGVHFWKRPWTQKMAAMVLVALCFASHILTDMKLSGWEVYLFWPFSGAGIRLPADLRSRSPPEHLARLHLHGPPVGARVLEGRDATGDHQP